MSAMVLGNGIKVTNVLIPCRGCGQVGGCHASDSDSESACDGDSACDTKAEEFSRQRAKKRQRSESPSAKEPPKEEGELEESPTHGALTEVEELSMEAAASSAKSKRVLKRLAADEAKRCWEKAGRPGMSKKLFETQGKLLGIELVKLLTGASFEMDQEASSEERKRREDSVSPEVFQIAMSGWQFKLRQKQVIVEHLLSEVRELTRNMKKLQVSEAAREEDRQKVKETNERALADVQFHVDQKTKVIGLIYDQTVSLTAKLHTAEGELEEVKTELADAQVLRANALLLGEEPRDVEQRSQEEGMVRRQEYLLDKQLAMRHPEVNFIMKVAEVPAEGHVVGPESGEEAALYVDFPLMNAKGMVALRYWAWSEARKLESKKARRLLKDRRFKEMVKAEAVSILKAGEIVLEFDHGQEVEHEQEVEPYIPNGDDEDSPISIG